MSTTRRRTEWFDQSIRESVITVGSQSALEVLDQLDDALIQGATITRILGRVYIIPNTANVDMHWYGGLIVVTSDALVANAVPDPSTDEEQGWLWKDYALIVGNLNEIPEGGVIRFDSRSQRILRRNEDRLVFVQDSHADGGGTMRVSWMMRVLLKHR